MTTRTLTALFDSHADAERGRQRLAQVGIPADMIEIMDEPASSQKSPEAETHGIWEKFKELLIPGADRSAYEEGIRRGGSLLTAPVEDPLADRAISALEECQPIDIDQRATEWRQAGWNDQSQFEATGATTREEVIPVAEEQLRVGKRETERGGVRVRSYLIEEPVQEDVRLREEHVDVERRPASQATSTGTPGELLKERTVEMREMAEEPVVQKEMDVKEEVVVRKRAEERTQPVKETVRRTQVDVEDNQGKTTKSGTPRGDEGRQPRH
jgi:uncharacterized protein (TIGR02271 family)